MATTLQGLKDHLNEYAVACSYNKMIEVVNFTYGERNNSIFLYDNINKHSIGGWTGFDYSDMTDYIDVTIDHDYYRDIIAVELLKFNPKIKNDLLNLFVKKVEEAGNLFYYSMMFELEYYENPMHSVYTFFWGGSDEGHDFWEAVYEKRIVTLKSEMPEMK
jgi:hypothetical protein